jgi:pimeloyl-ACP methyl ester carboxylesterase
VEPLLRRLLPAAALAAALLVPATSHAAIAWGPCPEAEFQAFECSTTQAPLDHSGATGGTVPLFARRLRAGGANPGNVALVALSGGPGQSAAASAADFAVTLATGVRERDLLVFDQRGTGRSGQLQCPSLDDEGTAPEVVGRCAQQLGPARGFYRTADSVEDLELLRREGGYAKLALFGVSYGTKVALDYAARYPERTERLVLDSIVPQEGPDPLVRSSVAAMRRVLRDLCGGGRCRRATSDVVGDLRRLVTRGPRRLRGTYVDNRGRKRRSGLDGSALYAMIQAGDTNPGWRAQLPAAMRAAVRGDEAALLRIASNVFRGPSASGLAGGRLAPALQVQDRGSNPALFVATICEEVRFPWERTASLQTRITQAEGALRALPNAAVSPFDRSAIAGAGLLSLCVGWPNASPPPAAPGPLPAVPALLLSGAADVRTPAEDAGAIAARLPGAQAVVVPFVGHSVLGGDPSGCAGAAVAGFFLGQPIGPCQNRGPIVAPVARSPKRLSALPRSGGLGGTPGRTLTAVLRTRDDSLVQAIALGLASQTRSGGLRGGVITVRDAGVSLRAVEVVEGVRVTGTFPSRGNVARLRVTGSSAARGTLRVTRAGAITGSLGGRRVRLTRARGASAGAAGPTWDIAREVERLRPYDLGPS